MGYTPHPSGRGLKGQVVESPDATEQPLLTTGAVDSAAQLPKKSFIGGWLLRRKVVLFSCIGLFVLAVGIASPLLYQDYRATYNRDKALAQHGVQHLQTAERLLKSLILGSLNSQIIMQAQQEFTKAFVAFSQIENDVKPVPGILTSVPKYGSFLGSIQRLVPLALEVSQAGVIGCDALTIMNESLRGALDTSAQSITMGKLITIKKEVAQLQSLLNIAVSQMNELQPSDALGDSRLGLILASFRTELPTLSTDLQEIQAVLSIAPTLLGIGQPASFLIEQLDSTEIRPGGGFIGSYGIVTFSGGRLANIQLRDTYLLDNAFLAPGRHIPYPTTYTWFHLMSTWSLRDSNLDADFPTAAHYAEQLYHTEGGTGTLQGVIAITPWLIKGALKITGPIFIPEYNETITAQNIVDRIHFHQLNEGLKAGDVPSPDGHSSLRKRFTEILFEHFFARVRQIATSNLPQFVSLLCASLQTKDLQLYLNAPMGENLLQRYQVASQLQSPGSDSLFVVDANVSSNKANNFMTYKLHDQVTIDGSGNALHHTTLTYNWPSSQANLQNDYGHTSIYNDYVRIYVPPDSTLLAQRGWKPQGTSVAFQRKVLAGIFRLPYGQTGEISLTWAVRGAAIHDASGWHYQYLIQRQAGITWHLNLSVTLPSCTHAVRAGNTLVFGNGHSGTLNQNLTTDMNANVNYSC